MGKKSGSGIRRDEQPGSYFRELRNNFWVRDPGWKEFGSGIEKIRIRDKNPDRQHCKKAAAAL
jgi:hypothetical protein